MPADNARIPASFWWLNLTQFLGAFNDNVFRFLIVFFVVAQDGETGAFQETKIVTITAAIFVVPFLLFSHAGGVLADRYGKRQIILILKYVELFIMLAGLVGLWLGKDWLLYVLLFAMCAQSAFFGPSKYGIIPEIAPPERLSRANGYLAAASYLAIILGTFWPTFFLRNLFAQNFLALSVFCVAIAVFGVLVSHRIVRTPAAGRADSRFTPLFVVDIFKTVGSLRTNRYLLLAVLALAYFLFLAAFFQQNLMIYGSKCLRIGFQQSGYLFPLAAVGIGLGAMTAGRLSGRNIEIGIVPIGALGLTAGALILAWPMLTLPGALLMIFLTGVGAGMFEVPLSAFVQHASATNRRGEVLACVNFLSFLGAAISAGLIYLLQETFGLSSNRCFLIIGALTGVLAVGTLIVLPDFFVRFVGVVLIRLFYRLTIRGEAHLPPEGGALLVANHVTWVDPLLIMATTQRRIRFVMARDALARNWLRPILRLMHVIPISPNDPPRQIVAALNDARRSLNEGRLVCIFAEGAISRNGNMRGFRPGFERIVRDTNHPVIPIHIGGGWGSIFSYYHGQLLASLPRRIPYPISILFGEPRPATVTADELRLRILELSVESVNLRKRRVRVLPARFVRAARRNWFRPAIVDTTGRRLTFGQTLTAAVALAGEMDGITRGQKMIGILLPASAGGALTNVAVTLLGKVAVNLNFTASSEALRSAIRQCEIRTIVSSAAFPEKLPGLGRFDGLVMLEDLSARIGPGGKAKAALKSALLPTRLLMRGAMPRPDDLATVIFSSGSTGDPKGVMLSHHNVLSNIESFQAVLRFTRQERMGAILPLFHSFGFTTTLWCPLVTGFEVFYHPNPLDGAKIAEMAREHRLTILLSTPTFLLSYMRRAKPEDFRSLRALVVGAEKLKKPLADAFHERFGIRLAEGYGATELSPVVAVNIPDVSRDGVTQVGTKEGSVGHPLPEMAVKVVDPETRVTLKTGQEGALLVKGPNVMMGYLNDPKKTAEVLQDGWYDTGDLARIDEDGFVFILDRLSRYSKIGGEMVPHVAIEEKLCQALGTMNQAVWVTSAADEKKGEQLVVFFADEAGTAEKLFEIAKASDLPNLWKPKRENFVRIEVMPTLGSGKLDLRRMREMAREFVAGKPTLVERVAGKILGKPRGNDLVLRTSRSRMLP
ncbi:MAG: acyl-[ACP]--phospholipid O-acyltransferase [Verrucomicrobiota bacterium]|nr:acyl-[ACP]--phospholipid O-acyltransferase [Verrucomicrobiota bacterium]